MTIASAFLATSQPAWRSQRFSPQLWFLFRSHRNSMRSTLERRPPGIFCPTRGDLLQQLTALQSKSSLRSHRENGLLEIKELRRSNGNFCACSPAPRLWVEERIRPSITPGSRPMAVHKGQPSQQFLEISTKTKSQTSRYRSVHSAFELWLLALLIAPGFPEGIGQGRPEASLRTGTSTEDFHVSWRITRSLRWLLSPTSTESRRPT